MYRRPRRGQSKRETGALRRPTTRTARFFRKTAFLIDMGGKRKHSTPIGLAKDWVSVLQSCYPGMFIEMVIPRGIAGR